MAQLAAIASVVGTVVSVAGTIAAGNAQKEAAYFQAAQQDQQATQELAASQRDQQEFKRVKDLALSRQRAVAGASGLSVTDPSVLYLAGETAARGRYQEELALYGGLERQRGLRMQADATRLTGNAAQQGATYSALGTLLSGGASFFDKYGKLNGGFQSTTQMPRYIYG